MGCDSRTHRRSRSDAVKPQAAADSPFDSGSRRMALLTARWDQGSSYRFKTEQVACEWTSWRLFSSLARMCGMTPPRMRTGRGRSLRMVPQLPNLAFTPKLVLWLTMRMGSQCKFWTRPSFGSRGTIHSQASASCAQSPEESADAIIEEIKNQESSYQAVRHATCHAHLAAAGRVLR